MQASKYNIFFEKSNKRYVFNSYSGALAELNDGFFSVYNSLEKNDNLSNPLVTQMKNAKIIYDDNVNELELVKKDYEKIFKRDDTLSLTLVPSYFCNYSCPYCFEKRNTFVMKRETINQILNFVEKSIDKFEKLNITWFGGEPLIQIKIIEEMSKKLIEICAINNKEYTSTIITNAYFITENMVQKFKDLEINSIQITLDGLKHSHDIKKFTYKGESTFDKTVNAIKLCVNAGIEVNVRINVDKTNFNELDEILDYLKSNNLTVNVGIGIIYSMSETNIHYDSECFSNDEANKLKLEFKAKLFNKGFIKDYKELFPKILHNACFFISKNCLAIDPYGDIYKCLSELTSKNCSCGSISSIDSINKSINCQYDEWSPFNYEECKNCNILPLCFGGCPYQAMETGKAQCSEYKNNLDEYLKNII